MGRRSLLVANVVEVLEHWTAGRPLRAIAESRGLDRNTVRKYITPAREAGFGPSTGPPPEGWAAFVARVCPRLGTARTKGAAWQELAARHDEIAERLKVNRPSTVWQRMHDEDGLRASLPSFRRYALATFPEASSRRPSITVRRDDPPPGEEAQVDFGRLGTWTDPVSGQTMILHAFILVLSFSRHMFVAVVRHMDAATWLACHVRAFSFFGSVPRRIILDNLKSGVLHPDLYDPLLNRGYAELAQHFGWLIDPARSAKPKDKPRVERQVPFVRESFWTGRSFGSLEEINAGAERWCLRMAGPRDRGTTHAPPLLLFQTIEQPTMLTLPAAPFEIVTGATAKVGRDCHAQVQNSVYSIPSRYVGQRLDVRLGAKLVRLYAGTELAKTHLRGKPGQRQTDWNAYPPEQAAFFQRTPTWCREQASQLGEHGRAAVDELLDQHHLHYLRQSQGIIRLADKYGQARLDAACQRALAYGNAHYRTIKTILEKSLEPHLAEPAPPPITTVGAYLRGPEALFGSTTPVQEEIPA
jgi:transposase